MNLKFMKQVMELYTEFTQITTIMFEIHHTEKPLCSYGIEYSILIAHLELYEVICFISQKVYLHSVAYTKKKAPASFYSYTTKGGFTYNIVVEERVNKYYTVISGPFLTSVPEQKQIKKMCEKNNAAIKQIYHFESLIYNLPLYSPKKIFLAGEMLLSILNGNIPSKEDITQDNYGRLIDNDIESNDSISNYNLYYYFTKEFYKIIVQLTHHVAHGDVEQVTNVIGENIHIFYKFKTLNDNNRLLKNMCIMISSVACSYSAKTNVSYEKMLCLLWDLISDIERMGTSGEIVNKLIHTMKELAQEVSLNSNNTYSLHINRVLRFINQHFAEKITLKSLSEYENINPVYLSSLIKKETELSLSQHINQVRIKEGKRLLLFTNKSIKDISYDVGYNHQSHFNNIFKNMTGVTPVEYRRNNRNIADS